MLSHLSCRVADWVTRCEFIGAGGRKSPHHQYWDVNHVSTVGWGGCLGWVRERDRVLYQRLLMAFHYFPSITFHLFLNHASVKQWPVCLPRLATPICLHPTVPRAFHESYDPTCPSSEGDAVLEGHTCHQHRAPQKANRCLATLWGGSARDQVHVIQNGNSQDYSLQNEISVFFPEYRVS